MSVCIERFDKKPCPYNIFCPVYDSESYVCNHLAGNDCGRNRLIRIAEATRKLQDLEK